VKNPYILGEKLYLRPLDADDAPVMQPWVNDPEVTRNLSVWRPMQVRDELEFIERSQRDSNGIVLGIVPRASDRLIGTAGLHRIDWKNRSAGFGIEIGVKEEWGKGFGAEATRLMVKHAFETMNLHRVWLQVYEFNLRGIRCYERAGFQREGVHRQFLFADGRYWDALTMAVLREESGAAAS
jgi:[ribosomal protein S5]-alanine N-acetyltransferase